jgi:ATP-binding cassette subfamily F protein uup
LFAPERCRQPVKALSGGERNRLLLAKLFTQPSNVLVLDEPTNDLDIDTLDLLEELLINYKGTLILVSHDRAFLNNVVTSTLVFEGNGIINQYVGGYDDWLRQRAVEQPTVATPVVATTKPKSTSKKLSYKDQRELDQLPEQIEGLEIQIGEITELISQPDFYKSERAEIEKTEQQLADVQQQLNQSYQRWEELDAQQTI